MQSRRPIVLGTFALLLLVALAVYFAPFGSSVGRQGRSQATSNDDVVASLPALAVADEDGAATRSGAARSEAASAPAEGLLREGRIVVLDGGPVPPGTRVYVRLDDPDFMASMSMTEWMKFGFGASPKRMRKFTLDSRARRKRGAEAEVATDGSFRIDAPKSGDFFVQVDSDTLFFDLYPKQRADSSDPIRLRARRGVVLRGRVASPDGAPVAGARVFYYSSNVPAMWGRVKTPREIDTTSAADGSFTLRAVPASEAGSVTASKTGFASTTTPRRGDADGGAPLAVVLVPGGRLIGRVVRADGAPVEGASVSPLGATFTSYMNDVAERDPSITRGDGAFELVDLMPGRVKLRAEREGLRPATHDGVDVRPGSTVDVGVLVMPKGTRLAGEVQTPDGEPSPSAVVTLGFSMQSNQLEPGEGGATTSDQETTTADAQGRFAFEGMGRGPYDLEATASGFAPARRKRFLDDGKLIVLKLRRPGAVEGSVRMAGDAAPVGDFEITIEQQRQFGPAFSVNERVSSRAFHAADGRYRLEDVPPGTYAVVARAKGFARGRITDVKVVASSPAQVDFDLVPGVTVAGTVVDRTTRRGLAGARVSLMLSMMDLFRQDLPETTADDDGRFTLADLDPGLVAVSGQFQGRARATVTVGDMAPGARADGVEIPLASGGAITGVAFGEDGLPMAGGLATANSPAFGEFRQVTLDADGRFQMPNLAPGTYQVSILRGSFLSESGGGNTAAMLQGMRFATAEVKEGETCFLSIGTESEKAVAVRGRVRSGGAPVASALVAAIPRGESANGARPRFTSTDSEGRFELKVPPGRVTFQVQRGGFAQTSVEHPVDVPDARTYELTITLPQASVEGSVRGGRGEPLANVQVLLSADQGASQSIFGTFGQSTTDEEGRYRFDHISDGTYLVTAGGTPLFNDAATPFGRVSTRVEIRDGGPARGVDFTLQLGGTIAGTVSREGAPVAGASIFLQSPDGKAVSRLSDVFSSAAGGFRAKGVAPGTYRLLARAMGSALRVIEPVVVESGRETQVAIELTAGAETSAAIVDKDGAPLAGASVDLFDEQGRRLSGYTGVAEMAELFSKGAPPAGVVRLGTLAPGRYRARATREGYAPAEKSFSIEGTSPISVQIPLEKS